MSTPDTKTPLSNKLDLSLAWRRVKRDLDREITFFEHPYERMLIALNEEEWLGRIASELDNAKYRPRNQVICEIPKPKSCLRPGGLLSLVDQVVYYACVETLGEQVRSLCCDLKYYDYANHISRHAKQAEWFSNAFNGWKHFDQDSLELMESDPSISHVLITDISGFYEHIDISLLSSDLRCLAYDQEVMDLLTSMLNKWAYAFVAGRSLPQGYSASHILAKLYLHSLDVTLENYGWKHKRYVDDIRIFCPSFNEARAALRRLICELRHRGLTVQTSKTEIYARPEAVKEIEGIQPVLQTILQDYMDRISEIFKVESDYFTLPEAEELIRDNPDNAPVEIICDAYDKYIKNADLDTIDKTLLHFLLSRLGRLGNGHALEDVGRLFAVMPHEFKSFIKYYEKTQRLDLLENLIVQLSPGAGNMYDYQLYAAMKSLINNKHKCSELLTSYVRRFIRSSPPPFLRSYCLYYLSIYGVKADYEEIAGSLNSSSRCRKSRGFRGRLQVDRRLDGHQPVLF